MITILKNLCPVTIKFLDHGGLRFAVLVLFLFALNLNTPIYGQSEDAVQLPATESAEPDSKMKSEPDGDSETGNQTENQTVPPNSSLELPAEPANSKAPSTANPSVESDKSNESDGPDKPAGSNGPAPSDPSGETAPETEVLDFDSLSKQLIESQDKINRLYGSITLGFPEHRNKIMAEIKELKEKHDQIEASLDLAAAQSFAAAPQENFAAAEHLFQLMSQKIDGKSDDPPFDPAAASKIGKLLTENGVNGPPVLYQAFRASFALQDFEQAATFLKELEATGTPLQKGMREHLESTQKNWQKELAVRGREQQADDLPRVKFETSEGDFVVELFENQAPQTVGNFISLVENNFYNDLTFHDVRPGQFAQTGSPKGEVLGDAGYYIPNETTGDETRHFFTGSLGMVHWGKDTAGSQFLIAHQPVRSYDGVFTCFGRVIEGMDVVYRLHRAKPVAPDAPPASLSGVQPPSKIKQATVLRKRDHDYKPTRIVKPANPNSIFGNSGRLFNGGKKK